MAFEITYLTCWAEERCASQILKPRDVTHESDSAHERSCAIASQNGFACLVDCNGGS